MIDYKDKMLTIRIFLTIIIILLTSVAYNYAIYGVSILANNNHILKITTDHKVQGFKNIAQYNGHQSNLFIAERASIFYTTDVNTIEENAKRYLYNNTSGFSFSQLEPFISKEEALYQVSEVAAENNLSEEYVKSIINSLSERSLFRIHEEPIVNTNILNMHLLDVLKHKNNNLTKPLP